MYAGSGEEAPTERPQQARMKLRRRYKITIEDEAHLRTVAETRPTALGAIAVGAGIFAASVVIAGMLLAFTPLRNLLPGYLKDSQRAATEEGLMRLDSLRAAYEVNQAYIDNYLRVTDENRIPSDSAQLAPAKSVMITDSLLGASEKERNFISSIEERERFNISVLAPLAADGIMFSPVCPDGIFTAASRESTVGEVIMSANDSFGCIADGTVIAVYHSAPEHGYVIVIQHNRGFVSSYTHVGTPLVGIGDTVTAGQMIALAPSPDRHGKHRFYIRMWHDGAPIIPYQYVGNGAFGASEGEAYEDPRGKL